MNDGTPEVTVLPEPTNPGWEFLKTLYQLRLAAHDPRDES